MAQENRSSVVFRRRHHRLASDRELARDQHRLGAVAGAEFAQDRGHVRLDRGFGNAQFVGDLFVEQAVAQHLHGRTVAFVLHAPKSTVLDGAKERLDALLARDQPCERTDETITNAAGKPLYVIVVADYRTCGVTAKPP